MTEEVVVFLNSLLLAIYEIGLDDRRSSVYLVKSTCMVLHIYEITLDSIIQSFCLSQ